MFTLRKKFRFEAGHSLPHHDGKCRHPHGHSYVLEVEVQSPTIQEKGPKKGMVMDFGDISSVVKPMIEEYFDHKWLNDTLNTDMTTAEYIAQWIFLHLQPIIPLLSTVTVYETADSSATYTS